MENKTDEEIILGCFEHLLKTRCSIAKEDDNVVKQSKESSSICDILTEKAGVSFNLSIDLCFTKSDGYRPTMVEFGNIELRGYEPLGDAKNEEI